MFLVPLAFGAKCSNILPADGRSLSAHKASFLSDREASLNPRDTLVFTRLSSLDRVFVYSTNVALMSH